MSTVVAERLITADEFLCMEENKGAEWSMAALGRRKWVLNQPG